MISIVDQASFLIWLDYMEEQGYNRLELMEEFCMNDNELIGVYGGENVHYSDHFPPSEIYDSYHDNLDGGTGCGESGMMSIGNGYSMIEVVYDPYPRFFWGVQ